LVQGGTLVTFPAASSICTSPSEHDLTSARRSRRPAWPCCHSSSLGASGREISGRAAPAGAC
jgi:hypothetical protein